MGFQDAVRSCFQKYIVITGRAPRSEYWWWVLFVILGSLAAGLLDSLLFGSGENAANVLEPLFGLAVFLPSICVGGRRLHDRDMSAWWLLLMLIPLIGQLVLLVIYLFPGTPGPNRFGPDPLGRDQNDANRAQPRDPPDDGTFTRSNIPSTRGDDQS